MTLLSFYTALLHSLIGLGIVVFAVADERPESAVLAVPVVIVAYAMRRRTWEFGLPPVLLNLLLVAITLWIFSTATWALDQTVGEIAQYIMLVQLLRLFEKPTSRKWTQEIGLSAMLVLAAALTNVALGVGVLIFLYAVLMLVTVLAHQVCVGVWRHTGPARTGQRVAARVTPAMRRDFLRIGGAATVIVALGATIIFIAMPRGIGQDMFFDINVQPSRGTESDFADSVTLGERGRISESASPVMRVTPRGYFGSPPFRLRGVTLDAYDTRSHRWFRSEEQINLDTTRDSHRLSDSLWEELEPGEAVVRVELLRAEPEYVFSLATAREAAFEGTVAYSFNPDDGTIRVDPDELPTGSRYAVRSVRTGAINEAPAPIDPSLREPFEGTAIPSIARGVLAEAGVDLTDATSSTRARAVDALLAYLRDGFGYTLDQVSPPVGVDPLSYFLTDTRTGHCEYFASSLAALCRSVGINARVVSGFLVYDDADSTGLGTSAVTVRQSNAHAWTEVEIAPGQWREYDPSPPEDIASQHVPAAGFAGAFRGFMDAVQIAWSKYVVNYDDEQQRSTIQRATGTSFSGFDTLDQSVRDLSRMPASRFGVLAGRSLAMGLFAFALVYGLLTLVRRFLNRSRRRPRAGRRRAPLAGPARAVERAYLGMLDALDRAGLAKPEWRPPAQHLSTLGTLSSEARKDAHAITELYYRVIFAERPASPEDSARVSDALDRLRSALRESRKAARA